MKNYNAERRNHFFFHINLRRFSSLSVEGTKMNRTVVV